MNAIILVGGLGTRLRPLTLTQPKALLPVLNQPFLTYQLDLLREAGVKNVTLASGKIIKRWQRNIKNLEGRGLKINFSYEPSPLGTGGAIRFCYDALKRKGLLNSGPVLVFNGDIFFEFDVRKFISFHRKNRAEGTILLTKVEDPTRFGVVSISAGGQIRKFVEKPKDASFGRLVNAGAYALEASWIAKIPSGRVVSIERESFPISLANKERMFGYKMNGYWNDIGTPDTYLKAHQDLMTVSNRWTDKRFLRKRGFLSNRDVRVSGSAVMGSSVILGKNIVIEGVVSCGDNVHVGDNCVLRDCVLMDGVRVEQGCAIDGSIIGRHSRIQEFSQIGKGSVLGDRTNLLPFTRC